MKIFVFFIALSFLVSCSSDQNKKLSEVVVGKWCELIPVEKECYGVMDYLPDGKYEFEATLPQYNKRLESSGVWEIRGKDICITPKIRKMFDLDAGVELPESNESLESYCDTVVDFEENKIIIDTPFFEANSILFRVGT